MGLDNGIIVKGKTKRGKELLKRGFDHLLDAYSTEISYDFAYWRKCWNIRGLALRCGFFDEEESETYLTLENLEAFVENVLKHFLIEENWSDYGHSQAFTWSEMIGAIGCQIHDIRMFLEYVEMEGLTDEDFEICFYDSY